MYLSRAHVTKCPPPNRIDANRAENMFSSSARRLGSLAKRHGLKAAAAVGATALGATAVCEPIEQKLVARLEVSSTNLTSS